MWEGGSASSLSLPRAGQQPGVLSSSPGTAEPQHPPVNGDVLDELVGPAVPEHNPPGGHFQGHLLQLLPTCLCLGEGEREGKPQALNPGTSRGVRAAWGHNRAGSAARRAQHWLTLPSLPCSRFVLALSRQGHTSPGCSGTASTSTGLSPGPQGQDGPGTRGLPNPLQWQRDRIPKARPGQDISFQPDFQQPLALLYWPGAFSLQPTSS